jgi:signal transduction histidine kinase
MKRLFVPTLSRVPPNRSRTRSLAVDARLRGGWLMLARTIWIALTVLTVIHFFASLPNIFILYQKICASGGSPESGCVTTPTNVVELQAMGLSVGFLAIYNTALVVFAGVVCFVVGAVIFWRTWEKSTNLMALFVSLALVMFAGVVFTSPTDSFTAVSFVWQGVASFLAFFAPISVVFFSYLFPDGRFVPRWTGAMVGLFALLLGYIIFFPDSSLKSWLVAEQVIWVPGILAIGLFSQIYRYRRVSNLVQRQQTRWVVFGFAVAVVVSQGGRIIADVLVHPPVLFWLIETPIVIVSILFVPFSICFAILRFRLWDIDIIINRTLVYATLTISVVGVYVLVVGGLGTLLQAQANPLISLLAIGLAAVLFQPMRNRLQQAVNRLIYGERDDPYAVLSRLGQRIEATLAPEAVLPTIVETVAQALKLPYAAITLKQEHEFSIVASYGDHGESREVREELLHLPLVYQTEQVGELILAQRAPGESFTSADRSLLDDLARQAGIAAHAMRLTTDLQRSRERLVTAREEERRRLRRDLHDGLGPALATLSLQAEAARDAVSTEPALAVSLMNDLITQTQAAITDIRRLVYDLRPPALDDLGLVAAIRAQAIRYEHLGLQVTVKAPESLPPLPAAVEVAAYRIIQEALTNIVRHAHTCLIRLTLDNELHLEITDDGRGIPADRPVGVGLRSMHERTAELGGSCIVEALSGGGTRIQVILPRAFQEIEPASQVAPGELSVNAQQLSERGN